MDFLESINIFYYTFYMFNLFAQKVSTAQSKHISVTWSIVNKSLQEVNVDWIAEIVAKEAEDNSEWRRETQCR